MITSIYPKHGASVGAQEKRPGEIKPYRKETAPLILTGVTNHLSQPKVFPVLLDPQGTNQSITFLQSFRNRVIAINEIEDPQGRFAR